MDRDPWINWKINSIANSVANYGKKLWHHRHYYLVKHVQNVMWKNIKIILSHMTWLMVVAGIQSHHRKLLTSIMTSLINRNRSVTIKLSPSLQYLTLYQAKEKMLQFRSMSILTQSCLVLFCFVYCDQIHIFFFLLFNIYYIKVLKKHIFYQNFFLFLKKDVLMIFDAASLSARSVVDISKPFLIISDKSCSFWFWSDPAAKLSFLYRIFGQDMR